MADQTPQTEDPNIKLLREKAEASDALLARAEASERKIALLEAGIDTGTELGKFFAESWKGDVSDVEALKAEATKLGVPFKGTPAPDASTPEGGAAEGTGTAESGATTEPTGSTSRQALNNGGSNAGNEQADPREVAEQAFKGAMEKGATWQEAAGNMLNSMANAAQQGDPRVIYTGPNN